MKQEKLSKMRLPFGVKENAPNTCIPLRWVLLTGLLCVSLFASAAVDAKEGVFPGKTSEWMGFVRHDFEVDGRSCLVVEPKLAAEGKPWVWRARFFGHQPQADIALLKRGFHLAYIDVGGLFGSPQAIAHGNAFYDYLDREHFFSQKPVLFGFSRGGLFIYRWAAENPEKVSCLYGDAPVCDFKSWPLGQGSGTGSPGDWKQCLAAYDMSEEEALAFKGNPVDQLAPLAKAGIPILHVVGDADRVVPVAENTAIIEKRYQELGGTIQVISKPDVGHHPHSLEDPKPIVDFVLKHTQAKASTSTSDAMTDRNLHLNGQQFQNARHQFLTSKKGHVAFMGGSITEMDGYRPIMIAWLEKTFPETQFTYTDAGISSTCSTTGAFRLKTDVLAKGPVDLFFVEFAVNDDQDAGHARRECIRGMEGIIRQVREHNPSAEIVVTHFVNQGMLATWQKGEVPLTADAHSEVAKHYGVSVNNLAREVANRITEGNFDWATYGGVHPGKPGNEMCASMIQLMMEKAWKNQSEPAAYAVPKSMDVGSYVEGRFLKLKDADRGDDWALSEPDWKAIKGNKRGRYLGIPMLHASKPGSECRIAFEGKAIGAYIVAGPDAGVVEGSVDGNPFEPVDTFHRFSKGLHYPRTVIFSSELEPGPHELVLRISEKTSSGGHALRIVQMVAN